MNTQPISPAVGYALFMGRDPYYPQMAALVVQAAQKHGQLRDVIDLGCGVGASTLAIRAQGGSLINIIGVDNDPEMIKFCAINTMGDPRVTLIEVDAQQLSEVISQQSQDAVICSETFHLFNRPDGSLVPAVLAQAAKVLKPGGVLAFNLGPTGYAFSLPIAYHRTGEVKSGQIMTELSHPLYQRLHDLVLAVIRENLGDEDLRGLPTDTLWPPVAAKMDLAFLCQACKDAEFKELRVSEELLPLEGKRVLEFMRNGWTVFFRWCANMPTEKKLALIQRAMNRLYQEPDFGGMLQERAYHPTAVFTAVKA